MRKYELTDMTEVFDGVTLHRIKAVRDIPHIGVSKGDLGGWVENERNLAQNGDAQVYGDARVYGDAWVCGDAMVKSDRHIFWASSVGSENGTLTAYTLASGDIEVTRGCFRGTIDEFEKAVRKRHGESRHEEEYLALIRYIRLRFREVAVGEVDD